MAVSLLQPENVWKLYYYLALFATILFVLKLAIFTVVGGDSEVNADFNAEVDTDASFNFLSSQAIIAFLMGFGWMGYAGLRQFSFEPWLNFSVAFGVGFVFMFVTAFLMFMVKKLEKNVKKDKATAVNQVGRAYSSFAPNSQGQIEIEINGQLTIANAMNESDQSINSFDLVRVTKIVDDLLYIEKVKK